MKLTLRGAVCALLLTLSLCFSACTKQASKPASASFEAMDTVMSLTVYGGDSDLCDRLKSRIEALDSALDATDENSEIYRRNTDRRATLGDDAAGVMNSALSLCEKLSGAFDITVYPAVCAWGFTTGEYRVPDDAELKTLADNIDYHRVALDGKKATLPENTAVDLSAIAKGYAADVCGDILKSGKADAAVLNLGGTIKLYGKKPDGSRFKVGIADPDNPAGYFGYLSCDDGVIATSGGYERYFDKDGKRYIHILDPNTAEPVENGVMSVTIATDSGADADALSTALFVMGIDGAAEYYREHKDFDFILLTDSGELYLTDGVYDDFTLGEGYDFSLHRVNG